MIAKIITCFFISATSLCAELLPVWDFLGEEGSEQKKYYIDSIRLKKLHDVNLFQEEPEISIGNAARIAFKALRAKYPDSRFDLGMVIFTKSDIRNKMVSYYKIHFTKSIKGEKKSLEVVFVMLDGEVLRRVPLSEWKKMRKNE